MRINRYLAQCGLGSRRTVEGLIAGGAVRLNGQPVSDLATRIDEDSDRLEVGGRVIRPATRHEYIMLNKPRGYDVTRGGRHHHRRAWDLLPEGTHPSVQSVGRLDRDSTGLLLFTNDGELAYRLTHPSHGCRKVYVVDVEGDIGEDALRRLREGVALEDGPAQALGAARLAADEEGVSRLRIEMAEGRKRIVRRMCEAVGHPVLRLERIALGPLELSDLRRGHTRTLRAEEVRRLRGSVGLEVPEPARRSRAGGEVRPAARTGRGKPVPRPRRPHRQGRR